MSPLRQLYPVLLLTAGALIIPPATVRAAIPEEGKPLTDELVPVKPRLVYGRIARIFSEGVPQTHVSHEKLGDDIADKALDNLISSLDYDHTVFLNSDIEQFRTEVS